MSTPSGSPRLWSRRAEGIAVVGFWAMLGVLMTARQATSRWRGEALDWGEVAETMAEFGLWALLTPAVFWVAQRLPLERATWVRRIAGLLMLGVGVAVVMESLTRGALRPLLTGPPPADRVWTLEWTFTRLRFMDEWVVYLAVLAAGYARAALFQAHEKRLEAERLLAERSQLVAQLTEARLSALRMQLNPHFLFNTLNAVSALVERDPAGVRTLVARLSSLLRRVLDADDAQEVSLADEAAFLRDYLDVQRIRFQGRLEIEEAWAPDTLDAAVPPLVLQPLVENAAEHGIGRKENGVGCIRLASRVDGSRLVLAVEDNGPGLTGPPERPGGVGLANTHERLDTLYGSAARLTVEDRAEGGVRAEVVLPYRRVPPGASAGGPSGDGTSTAEPAVARA
ncbi:MAG: histidine kinase [Bacteroidota bacterium]